jgi:tetratricopeptide (TPR) repeat protein
MNETTSIEIPVGQFDLALLPALARQPGTDAFRDAVTDFFQDELKAAAEWIQVGVDATTIRVAWRPRSGGPDPVEQAVETLKSGDYPRAVQILRVMVRIRPNDAVVRYNLGMALSDLGQLEEASQHLQVAADQLPDQANIQVALGGGLLPEGRPATGSQGAGGRRGPRTRQPLRVAESRSLPAGTTPGCATRGTVPPEGHIDPAGRPAGLGWARAGA